MSPLATPLPHGRGFASLGLYATQKDGNVAGALRAASVYHARAVFLQGPSDNAKKAVDHAMNTTRFERHTPVVITDDLMDMRPVGAVPVAIELTKRSVSLVEFEHPERAFYVFGPENGDIPDHVLDACAGVVYVPSPSGLCMNLAATVNVVLYDRFVKRQY